MSLNGMRGFVSKEYFSLETGVAGGKKFPILV